MQSMPEKLAQRQQKTQTISSRLKSLPSYKKPQSMPVLTEDIYSGIIRAYEVNLSRRKDLLNYKEAMMKDRGNAKFEPEKLPRLKKKINPAQPRSMAYVRARISRSKDSVGKIKQLSSHAVNLMHLGYWRSSAKTFDMAIDELSALKPKIFQSQELIDDLHVEVAQRLIYAKFDEQAIALVRKMKEARFIDFEVALLKNMILMRDDPEGYDKKHAPKHGEKKLAGSYSAPSTLYGVDYYASLVSNMDPEVVKYSMLFTPTRRL